jgi:GntR family transcriptional regulator
VRQAIDLLVSEGLIRREQGRGTYVLPEGIRLRSRLDTFFEHRTMLAEFGYTTSVQYLSTQRSAPDQIVQEALRLGPADQVVCFTKLFLADGKPAVLAKDFVPAKVVPDRYDEQGAGHDFFPFIEAMVGRRIEYLLSDVVPIAAPQEIAVVFQCPPGTPVLLLRELFLDARQQVPLQFAYNYHNPELIRYSILRKRRQP